MVGGQSQRRPNRVGAQPQLECRSRAASATVASATGDGEAVTDLSAYPVLTEEVSILGAPAPADRGARRPEGPAPDTADGGPGHARRSRLAAERRRRGLSGRADRCLPASPGGRAHRVVMAAARLRRPGRHGRADRSAGEHLRPREERTRPDTAAAGRSHRPQSGVCTSPRISRRYGLVVSTELQELVNELALAGGPRIQRVDELFRLLVGENRKSFKINPEPGPGASSAYSGSASG